MLWWFTLSCKTAQMPVSVPVPEAGSGFRIAFGSCAHQDKAQPALEAAAAMSPDLFVWLGDNIYGDTDNMAVLKQKYDQLGARPEFQTLWAQAGAVRAVWDDHDYGRNDAGREYPHKKASEAIFLDFWQVPEHAGRRQHEGIYGTEIFKDGDHIVQLILLDTRYFRGPIPQHHVGDGFKNDYRPHSEPGASLLGPAQWAWLAQTLQQPATLRIVASSTQFGHAYNGWESWTNFPLERQRMVRLLRDAEASATVFISGDVHWGEISRYAPDDGPPIYDVTSSGITQTWPSTEPNDNRVGDVVRENNFGVIDVDWAARKLILQLRRADGQLATSSTVPFDEIGVLAE